MSSEPNLTLVENDGADKDSADKDSVADDGADKDGADKDGADKDGADKDGADKGSGGPIDPRIGSLVDRRYVIKKLLGEGGMGVVYSAVHQALEKPVAIKVLKPDVSKDEKIIARFKREARAASAIGSPHICDVSDFGRLDDGSTYFVMEMLDGPSLSKALTGEPMETSRLLKLGSQLADALGAAHARQIVHRDLKPDNVHLVTHGADEEFVKVLDFGIAKVANSGETKLTQAGQVFGTPHYMSPEQCAGHDVDHRTDIYALGVMLYEMACGRVPFDADNLMGLLTKHVYEQPIPPRQLPPPVDVPPGLEAVILKCLAKKPSSRYQTMAELKTDLSSLARGATPAAVVEELDRSLPPRPDTPFADSVVPGELPSRSASTAAQDPGRRKLMVVGVGALIALAITAFGVTYVAMPPGTPASGPGPAPIAAAEPPPEAEPAPEPAPEPEPEPEPEADENPDRGDSPHNRSVVLHTEPSGAEVTGPDGSLVGNTPVTIIKPDSGEPAIEYRIHLSGFADRTFTVGALTQPEVRLTMDSRARRSRGSAGSRRGSSAARPSPASPPRNPIEARPARPASPDTPARPAPPAEPSDGPSRGDLRNPFGN